MAEKSPMFQKIKTYFDKKLWNVRMVKDAVNMGKLTQAEFKEITGEEYSQG